MGAVAGLNGTGRLADDLYLLAHNEVTGRSHLQPRALGLGLAGALLGELLLSGNLYLKPDQVVIGDDQPPRDGLACHVLGLVAGEPGQLPPRDWLLFLARTASEDVARRLARDGYLTRDTSRRPRRGERWIPVNASCAFAPLVRVKSVLDPAWRPADQNVALGGLASACGLGRHLAAYLPPTAGQRLQQAVGRLPPGLRDLIAVTQVAVDSALLAHRV